MKKLSILLLFCLFITNISFANLVPLDKIVVTVNNNIITQSDVNKAMQNAKRELSASKMPIPPQVKLEKQIINNLIDREIQRQMVKQAGIKISDAELNKAISNIAMKNNMSLEELKQALVREGINYADYRKQIREQMTFGRLQQQEIGGDVSVSKAEVQAFLQKLKNAPENREYHLGDILVNTKEKAQTIIAKINKGTSFTSFKSSDLGWRKLADMPAVFVSAVKKMQPKTVVGPIAAPNGFHILKLFAVRSGSINMTSQEARNIVYQRKINDKLQAWLKKLRETAYVKFM